LPFAGGENGVAGGASAERAVVVTLAVKFTGFPPLACRVVEESWQAAATGAPEQASVIVPA